MMIFGWLMMKHKTTLLMIWMMWIPVSASAGETHDHDHAQPHEHVSLTPEQAVERVLQSASWRPDFDAATDAVRADYAVQVQRPLPVAELTHEQIFGDPQVAMAQVTLAASQSLDLSNWREDYVQARGHEESAVQARARAWEVHITHQVRRAYFAVLYHSRRHEVHDAWLNRLVSSRDAVHLREEGGDDSLYSVRRIEREIELVRSRHASEHLDLAAARATLLAWLEMPTSSSAELMASLVPEGPITAKEDGLDEVHPELVRLEELEKAARVQADSLGKMWLRDWSFGGGYRFTRMVGINGHGLVLGISAPLPAWSLEHARRDLLEAHAAQLAAEQRIAAAGQWRAEQLAITQLTEALGALSRMTTISSDSSITQLAELAYSAGEATLAELLDAHESETELELERVELEWRARQASIDLDHARGRRQGAQ